MMCRHYLKCGNSIVEIPHEASEYFKRCTNEERDFIKIVLESRQGKVVPGYITDESDMKSLVWLFHWVQDKPLTASSEDFLKVLAELPPKCIM